MGKKISEEKASLREKIWNLLEQKKVARFPLPVKGRIPNFEGADKAADLLTTLPEWKKAKTILVNPDSPQQAVREAVLKEKKRLIMASPKLKAGYLLLEPEKVKGKERLAASIKGAFKFGKQLAKLPYVDLVVEGSVAVDKAGNRLGKGGGYGDEEIRAAKSVNPAVPVISTVHELQIVRKVPATKADQKVDIIITPEKVIKKG